MPRNFQKFDKNIFRIVVKQNQNFESTTLKMKSLNRRTVLIMYADQLHKTTYDTSMI